MKRRHFLNAAGSAAMTVPLAALSAEPAEAKRDLIRRENEKAGTADWQLTRVKLDKPGGVRASAIEGYCSRQSVLAGESIDILVSTATPAKYIIEIFRTGYYGGRGARLMQTLGPFEGKKQPDPVMGQKRLMECRWAPSPR
jgi:hypothetical protein